MKFVKACLVSLALAGCATEQAALTPQDLRVSDIMVPADQSGEQASCELTIFNIDTAVEVQEGMFLPVEMISQGKVKAVICGLAQCTVQGKPSKQFMCAPLQLLKKKQED